MLPPRHMCGICGTLRESGPADEASVRAMAAALTHRGPDADGFAVSGPAALGHRRLSIIDLSPEGRQPMANEDHTVLTVVNGEIYNFKELREGLVRRGHRFRSRSDSEVVVHLYEEKGEAFVESLRGMFALALWDAKARKLILARDRLGKKPIYYAYLNGRLAFASEAQALLRALDSVPEPDLGAIDQYLTLQYVPAPRTGFRGMNKVPAGHILVAEPGKPPALRRYWRLSFAPRPDAPRTLDEAAEQARPILEEAVRIRLMSDVPLGAFLSGGIDSSTIVAMMAQASSRPVDTFSIDFPGGHGEAAFARMVAKRWGTNHHEMLVQPDMVSVLPELVRRYGEPYADTSAVPVYYLSKMTRAHVTVALSGDGGDEVFGGYKRYLWDKLARGLRALGRPGEALRRLLLRAPGARAHVVRRFAEDAVLPMAARYLPLVAHFAPRDKADIAGPALRAAVPGADGALAWFEGILAASDATDDVNRLLDLDTQTYLPEDILVKVDIASMAHALEVRAPLLDHVLVEWMAGLSGDLKLRGIRGKRVLRRIARDLLPREILTRRKKGFSLPVDRWFREELRPLARDMLTDRTCRERGILDPGGVGRLLEAHDRGEDHGERLWNLLVLEMWFREQAAARTPAALRLVDAPG
jgi:asparagine synthase (glutamine-hydrolysing)